MIYHLSAGVKAVKCLFQMVAIISILFTSRRFEQCRFILTEKKRLHYIKNRLIWATYPEWRKAERNLFQDKSSLPLMRCCVLSHSPGHVSFHLIPWWDQPTGSSVLDSSRQELLDVSAMLSSRIFLMMRIEPKSLLSASSTGRWLLYCKCQFASYEEKMGNSCRSVKGLRGHCLLNFA